MLCLALTASVPSVASVLLCPLNLVQSVRILFFLPISIDYCAKPARVLLILFPLFMPSKLKCQSVLIVVSESHHIKSIGIFCFAALVIVTCIGRSD